jgi:hypothetical protein
MNRETKTMQKDRKHAKMAEKSTKSVFFFEKYLIFTKIIVTLPKNFSETPIKKLKFNILI